jgi:hypothetical protein
MNRTMTNFNTCDFKSTNDSMVGAYVLISSEIGYENIIIDVLMAIPQDMVNVSNLSQQFEKGKL